MVRARLFDIVFASLLAGVCALALPSSAHADPPDFGIEVEGMTGLGLSPYLRNSVRTETEETAEGERLRPYLVDEATGVGNGARARLVASNIAAGLGLRWFELPEERIHHRGLDTISPDRRRPDGTVDDAGVDYEPLRPVDENPIPEEARDTLLVFGLDGEYRFFWSGEVLDVFVPVGGGLVLTHVTREAAPFRLGLEASSGLGVQFDLADGFALMASGRLHALATPHYGRRSDAAYRSATIGETTEAAYFSTLAYASANLAVQFQIR
ncbi:MAG: hypothetical protein ACOCV2_05175 [Persicimonas sp.]